jgi:hypothetical protein
MSNENIFANVGVWFGIVLVLIVPVSIYSNKLEYGGLLIIVFAFEGLFFALCGAVVQGIFIKSGLYRLGPALSILLVGTLTLTTTMLIKLFFSSQDYYYLWDVAKILFMPSYAITAISYYVTQGKQKVVNH